MATPNRLPTISIHRTPCAAVAARGIAAPLASIALMAAATLMGVVEIPEHANRVNMQAQPAFAFAAEHAENGSTLRREREETGPHYISYDLTQRTPARSGKA